MKLQKASLVEKDVQQILPKQAESDEHLIRLWLHGKSANTQEGYARDIRQFLDFVGKGLHQVILGDIQTYEITLGHLAHASRARKISAVKSLFSFAHRLGYLPYDIGAPAKVPPIKDTLAERILEKEEVQEILKYELDPRNHAIIRLLYISGMRVSELCGLRWRDVKPRNEGGQITVLGKGAKTRVVLLPPITFAEMMAFKGESHQDAPVFKSKKGGALSRVQIYRIVRTAAERAGLWQKVSPHWMRHAHASHSLDNGAPIHLVQATLGHASVGTTGRYTHVRPDESSAKYLE